MRLYSRRVGDSHLCCLDVFAGLNMIVSHQYFPSLIPFSDETRIKIFLHCRSSFDMPNRGAYLLGCKRPLSSGPGDLLSGDGLQIGGESRRVLPC